MWSSFVKALTALLSKKFIVWAVATAALFQGLIDSTIWAAITMSYFGVQGIVDWRRDSQASGGTSDRSSSTSKSSTTVEVSTVSVDGVPPPVIAIPAPMLPEEPVAIAAVIEPAPRASQVVNALPASLDDEEEATQLRIHKRTLVHAKTNARPKVTTSS